MPSLVCRASQVRQHLLHLQIVVLFWYASHLSLKLLSQSCKYWFMCKFKKCIGMFLPVMNLTFSICCVQYPLFHCGTQSVWLLLSLIWDLLCTIILKPRMPSLDPWNHWNLQSSNDIPELPSSSSSESTYVDRFQSHLLGYFDRFQSQSNIYGVSRNGSTWLSISSTEVGTVSFVLRSTFCFVHNFLPEVPRFIDVSKNNGTPKWTVKIMENPIF